jgi:hypothetical protein
MGFDVNLKEFNERGFARPNWVHQAIGGRGGGLWHTAILGRLETALRCEDFLNLLASEMKAGDRISIGAYATQIDFREERLSELADVIVFDVRRPSERGKKDGRVFFHKLSYFDLAAAQKLAEANRLARAV